MNHDSALPNGTDPNGTDPNGTVHSDTERNAKDDPPPSDSVNAADTLASNPEGGGPALPQALYVQLHRALAHPTTAATQPATTAEELPSVQSFGHRLRRWRLQQGYTRTQLAAKSGIDPLTLLALEHALASPAALSHHQLTALYALIVQNG